MKKIFALLLSCSSLIHAIDDNLTQATLTNGVELWIQPLRQSQDAVACRFVATHPKAVAPHIFSLDCPTEIFEEEFPFFLDYCKESIPHPSECAIALITVGDFEYGAIEPFLREGLEIFEPRTLTTQQPAVMVDRSRESGVLSLALNYSSPRRELVSDHEIKEMWIYCLLQMICQERLQKAVVSVGGEAVHLYEPKHFLPYLQTTTLSLQKNNQPFDTILVASLVAMQELKSQGFSKAELNNAKAKLQKNIATFYSPEPNEIVLADYHTSHFVYQSSPPPYDSFMTTSLRIVSEISMDEMAAALAHTFADENRQVVIRTDFVGEEEGIRDVIEKDLANYPSNGLVFTPIDDTAQADLYSTLPISEGDAQIIYDIVDTIANTSLPKLLIKRSAVEKMGKRVTHVHPLRFLGTLFGNPYLKNCMAEIMDSYFKWSNFINGLAERLDVEQDKNNLYPYVMGFCQVVKANPDQVRAYIQKRKWEDLLIYLVKVGT